MIDREYVRQTGWRGVLLALMVLAAWKGPDVIRVGFIAGAPDDGLPAGWDVMTMKDEDRHTQYTLVRTDSTAVVKAVAKNSASALIRRVPIDPAEYPILEWRWKVENVLKKGNAREKSGADFAARIYVTFDYDVDNFGFFEELKYRAIKAMGYENVPARALNYIWASKVPRGTVLPTPYTDWVMMIAVRSGPTKTGTWITEHRNIAEDYRRAFGGDPPPINGIAIMTDTDNTGEKAVAYYGGIRFVGEGE